MLALACTAGVAAEPANASSSKPLRVVVKPAKPFAFEENGEWKGYSVDLWKAIAQKNQWQYEWVPVDTVPKALETLRAEQADVAVGALSVTEEREKVLDFSHSFYESGLQIVTLHSATGSILQAVSGLMSAPVLGGIGVLFVSILLVSWLLWRLERRHNPDSFPERAGAGLKESLWWSTNILIAGGCENISPTGTAGRLVAVVWMLGGIAFTSYITAVFTSTLTVAQLNTEVRSLQDLQGQLVATLTGSTSDNFVSARGIPVEEHETLDSAMGSLLNKDVKAVVYDAPMLKHWLMTHPREAEKVSAVGELMAPQAYAYVLPVGSPLRKVINASLLELRASGTVEETNRRWFGGMEASR